MTETQKSQFLFQLMTDKLNRAKMLMNKNRTADATAIIQEWMTQYDDKGNSIPIDFVNCIFS